MSYSMVASVALNAAFVGIWLAYAVASQPRPQQAGETTTQQAIWCPLHRELDITEAQWARIEPQLAEFQAAVTDHRDGTDAGETQ